MDLYISADQMEYMFYRAERDLERFMQSYLQLNAFLRTHNITVIPLDGGNSRFFTLNPVTGDPYIL